MLRDFSCNLSQKFVELRLILCWGGVFPPRVGEFYDSSQYSRLEDPSPIPYEANWGYNFESLSIFPNEIY